MLQAWARYYDDLLNQDAIARVAGMAQGLAPTTNLAPCAKFWQVKDEVIATVTSVAARASS